MSRLGATEIQMVGWVPDLPRGGAGWASSVSRTALVVPRTRRAPRVPSPTQCRQTIPGRKSAGPGDIGLRRALALGALMVGVLLALLCGFQGWATSHDTTQTIADIRVGQRVTMDAPWQALAAHLASKVGRESGEVREAAVTLPPEERVDPATWKLVRLRAELRWDDGTLDDVNVEPLQPPEWLLANHVRVGGQAPIPLDLVEMSLPEGLQAKVLAIKSCPRIAPGPGRIVLTTVNHLNANLHELTIRDAPGRRETIRTTGGHKFYCLTRGAWVAAAKLRPDERLDGLEGSLDVVSLGRLSGVHRVYNLTVQGEHMYRVSSLASLAHNTTGQCGPRTPTAGKPRILQSKDGHERPSEVSRSFGSFVPGYRVHYANVPWRDGHRRDVFEGRLPWI